MIRISLQYGSLKNMNFIPCPSVKNKLIYAAKTGMKLLAFLSTYLQALQFLFFAKHISEDKFTYGINYSLSIFKRNLKLYFGESGKHRSTRCGPQKNPRAGKKRRL